MAYDSANYVRVTWTLIKAGLKKADDFKDQGYIRRFMACFQLADVAIFPERLRAE